MTTLVALSPDLQHLVDSRLDSMDRILLSTGVIREERKEIVQSVEDQILELLARSDAEPTRDDVVSVLSAIDPPEAYLPAEYEAQQLPAASLASRAESTISHGRTSRIAPLAIISLVFGLLSLLSVPVWPISAVAGLGATSCGSIALTQIHYSGYLKGMWLSIAGLCSPAIALLMLVVLAL